MIISVLAFAIVTAAGIWLVGVAALMAARPATCIALFERMTAGLQASTRRRFDLTEQGLRILAGAALIVRAPASKLPLPFEIAGWALVLTSVLILALPVRWHAAYGAWWCGRLRPTAIRLLSPVPAIVGAGLIYTAA